MLDVQVGVVADAWEAPLVFKNVACAVERARAAGVPVIWVQHEADDLPREKTKGKNKGGILFFATACTAIEANA